MPDKDIDRLTHGIRVIKRMLEDEGATSVNDAVFLCDALLVGMQVRDAQQAGIRPHLYAPDYQTMGDCRVCCHGHDTPWHVYRVDSNYIPPTLTDWPSALWP